MLIEYAIGIEMPQAAFNNNSAKKIK